MALDDLIKITYNSQVISNRVDKIRERISYRDYEIEVDFLVLESSESDLVSTRQTFETALEADSKALLIEYGPSGSLTTMRTYDPASRTGLKIRTSLAKAGAEIDSHRAIRYTWRANVILPADSSDDSGRREATYSLDYTESRRRRFTFSGTYTGISAGGAKATYEAQVGTWISSIFTGLSITEANFEKISEQVQTEDDEDAVLNFTQVWQEVIFPEDSTGTYSSPNSLSNVSNVLVTFSRRTENIMGIKKNAPARVDINFSCAFDNENVTPETIENTWRTTIAPHLITQAKTEFGGNLTAVESEVVTPDMSENRLTAQMTLLISGGQGGLKSFEQTIEMTDDPGIQRLKLLDGNSHTYMFWSLGATLTATLTVSKEKIGAAPADSSGTGGTSGGELSTSAQAIALISPGLQRGEWLPLTRTIRDSPQFIGMDVDSKGTPVEIHRTTYTKQYLWTVKPNLRGTAERAINNQQARDKNPAGGSSGGNPQPSQLSNYTGVEIHVPGEPLDVYPGYRG